MSSTTSTRLLTAKEAAEYLAISTRKLWELTNRGEIPSIRIDRSVRYTQIDLDAYVATQRMGATK